MMYGNAYSEGQGRLLSGPHGFHVLLDEPHTMIWNVETDILEDMASSMQEPVDKISQSVTNVLSWARQIVVRVFFANNDLLGIRMEEILLEAIVTRVEPYCSELRAAGGRVLKVVQRLFDGNTPQLDTRYVIGIPWSRRDIKRHWASSVHKKVKIRKSELPGEIVRVEFLPSHAALQTSKKIDTMKFEEASVAHSTADDEPCSSASCASSSLGFESNILGASDPTKNSRLTSRPTLSFSAARNVSITKPTLNSCVIISPSENSYISEESDSALSDDTSPLQKNRPGSSFSTDAFSKTRDGPS